MTGRNIRFFYILEIILALSGGIILPAYVLYFRAFNITLFQVALLAVIFEATIIVFEIPTGIFADKFGRKLSTNIGFLLLTVSGIIFFMYQSFIGFLIAEIVFGIAETFISGALEALAVDSLDNENREKHLSRLMANRAAVKNGGLLIGMILGGLLAGSILPYLFAPVIFLGAVALSISLFLSESKSVSGKNPDIAGSAKTGKSIITNILHHKTLTALFAVGLMANLSFEGADQYWQVLFSEIINIRPEYFGIITAAGLIIVILTARFSERLYHRLSLYLGGCFALIAFSLFLTAAGGVPAALIGIVTYFALKEMIRPAISYHLNLSIPSNKRAVYLSGYNLSCSIGEVGAGVLVGLMAAEYGVPCVFKFAAVSALGILVIYLILQNLRIARN